MLGRLNLLIPEQFILDTTPLAQSEMKQVTPGRSGANWTAGSAAAAAAVDVPLHRATVTRRRLMCAEVPSMDK